VAKNEIRDLLTRSVGPYRSAQQVLGSVAAAPVAVLSTFELAVSTATEPGNSPGQVVNSPGIDVTSQVAQLNSELNQLRAAQASGLTALAANTLALAQNTAAKSSGGTSVVGTIGSIASNVFGGGLLSSVIGGLVGLFGGSGSSTPAPLIKFALPPVVNYEGGQVGGSRGQVVPVDFGQGGQPRAVTQPSAPQVNIQVNAMDSRSFLDHSEEIAQAVKKAILNSSSLNDVISDL
jgi:hypothetical protein